jgi:putative phage-type endonuclease
MNTHDHLIQGSQQWLAHRRAHFNASDAPAMMGCSPYKTRTQFLHEMHTGLVPEVDAATQRRFDDGHRFEALARPLAAAIIGEDLFPVTGTEGKLSASFDGLTMGEDVAFEHKSLNDDLRTVLELIDKGKYTARDLPDHYRIQMEQQCMVAGCGRVLFMASKWSGDELIEERHCWYESDAAMAAEIRAGWAQFEIDLFAYTPTEVVAPTAAASIESLPAVSVRMNGSLAVVSNLDLFGVKLRAFVDKIDMQPSTDQAFADAEAAVKTLGNAEDALIQAEASRKCAAPWPTT